MKKTRRLGDRDTILRAVIGLLMLVAVVVVYEMSIFDYIKSDTTIDTEVPSFGEQVKKIKQLEHKLESLEQRIEIVENGSLINDRSDKKDVDLCISDPLDDSCENGLTNFQLEPLIPETGNFCDMEATIHLNKDGEFKECDDPSCVSCRKRYIEKTSKLSSVFHSERSTILREAKIADFKDDILIVCSVNYGQVYLFLNWACSCVTNNLFDPRDFVYIVPTDEKTYSLLKKFGFKVEEMHWLKEAPKISETYKGGANVGGHALINNILAFTTNFFIQRDLSVILMDVDMVFLRSPFEYLREAGKRRDVLGMFSPRNDAYGFMNSGFLFMRPTQKTKTLTQSLVNMCHIKKQSDQQLWNAIIRHQAMNQIEQRILPRHLFFTLWKSTTKHGYDEDITILIHAVSVTKAKRLINLNQWYFKEECQFFDAAVEKQTRDLNLYEK